MKYTEINKYNYESASDYWIYLLRYGTTKEQEKEREELAILLGDYDGGYTFGGHDLAD